tara:strand:- start:29118 stop:29438 length:321 start_codon:yes stop_codon:yes gene_type:complete
MEAKELRIGNYFSWEGKSTTMKLGHFEDHLLYPNDRRKYQPIPLTEEWLVKFGFKFRDETDCWHLNYLTINKNFVMMDIDMHVYFDYVHQLQNLYYALTNKELIIK